MNILILATQPNNQQVQKLTKEFRNNSHQVIIVHPNELFLLVSNIENGYDRLYRDGEEVNRILLKDIDAVITRVGSSVNYAATIVNHLTKNLGIYSIQNAEGILNASNKLKTLQLLSSSGIRTPKTIYANNPKNLDFIIKKLGLPLIVKLIKGSQGVGVSILETHKTAETVLESFYKSKTDLVIQEYLDGETQDIRAIVIGNKVVASYLRKPNKNEFRANISLGATGEKIDLTNEEKSICLKAARAIGLDMAGIDLMRDKKGHTYCIEVNSNFGWYVEEVTGVEISKEIRMYLENRKGDAISKYPNPELVFQDEYLLEVLTKVHGNRLDYVDRNGTRQRQKVESIYDLHRVMVNSFKVQS